MWQNILVIAIVALTAALVARSFFRKFTGKASCGGGCSGCSSAGSSGCGGEPLGRAPAGGSPSGTPPRPLSSTGCGCGR